MSRFYFPLDVVLFTLNPNYSDALVPLAILSTKYQEKICFHQSINRHSFSLLSLCLLFVQLLENKLYASTGYEVMRFLTMRKEFSQSTDINLGNLC